MEATLNVRPMLAVTSPLDGSTVGEVPISTAEDVRAAVDRARKAQVAWGARSVAERCDVLRRVRKGMFARADAIASMVTREMGKPAHEAHLHDVTAPAWLISYYLGNAERILAPTPISLETLKHRASYVHYAPRGVVGVIGPWNFPVHLPFTGVAMALLAGNGVVLKPSEYTPLVADLVREIYLEAGVPADLFQIVHGYGDVGAALIDAGIDFLDFVGSARTGRKVAALCGERLVPYVLELGGKAPALVCRDAHLDRAVECVLWGGFVNAGQACVSVERCLVDASVYDRFVPRLVERARALRVGNPLTQAEVDVGPIANLRQREVVERQVADALAKGATLACGGKRIDGPGLFYEPTVLLDCTPEMAVMSEETFGPILAVMKTDDEEAMIAEANRTRHGLGAYVFTRDTARGRRLAERIEAGAVQVNETVTIQASPEAPWGGVKDSGIWYSHGEEGLRHFCQTRHVNYDVLPWLNRDLWHFPYKAAELGRMRKMFELTFSRGGDAVRKLLG